MRQFYFAHFVTNVLRGHNAFVRNRTRKNSETAKVAFPLGHAMFVHPATGNPCI